MNYCTFFSVDVCSGVPAIVDFAAMRDAVKSLGGDPSVINPVCPADLVIDHSVQVDYFRKYMYVYVCDIMYNVHTCIHTCTHVYV